MQSPDTEVLGITVVTGDAWRDEEVQHTLRLLEIIGRTDIPVVPGADLPSREQQGIHRALGNALRQSCLSGRLEFRQRHAVHGPAEIPPMPEGAPTTKASTEDVAHFLLRMVHQYPHEVTIYEGGPLTNLALAQAIDPQFASLAKELVLMGGSLNPLTDDPEFTMTPRREFNLWMDPEASRIVLHAPWPRIVVTTVDISVKTKMDKDLISQIGKSQYPAGQYAAKYAEGNYLWDELAAVAWLDPTIITKWKKLYLDVSIDHGASYGDTLVWTENTRPAHGRARSGNSGRPRQSKILQGIRRTCSPALPRQPQPTRPNNMTRNQRALKNLNRDFPRCPSAPNSILHVCHSACPECFAEGLRERARNLLWHFSSASRRRRCASGKRCKRSLIIGIVR